MYMGSPKSAGAPTSRKFKEMEGKGVLYGWAERGQAIKY